MHIISDILLWFQSNSSTAVTMQYYKDLLYLVGSILGIVGFIRTLKRRDKCEFNYRTELGDEVKPFIICIRGEIFNLEITDKSQSVFALKYPQGTNLSQVKYKKIDSDTIDRSSYFPIIREGEVISIPNDNLDMPRIFLQYEDKFHNRYYQTFEFNTKDIHRDERKKRKSRSCYLLSRRYFRFLWVWFPQIKL